MGRSTFGSLAVVAAIAFGGCNYKMAGSVAPSAKGGSSATGTAGAGGAGGSAGSAGGAAGGGRGGNIPIIYLDGGAGSAGADRNCGEKSKTATKVAPDILILLDRSGSMNDDLMNQMCRPEGGVGAATGCGPNSKWAKTIPAITQVVSETENDVNWGLKFFPDSDSPTNSCNVSTTAAVPIARANAAAIATAIMGATSANGGVVGGYNGTPTRSGMNGSATYLGTVMDNSPKFILMATDGQPTCPATGTGGTMGATGADDAAGATMSVQQAAAAGYKTFVVGISTSGTTGSTADTILSSMANAGGLPRAGTPTYYPVGSAADLAAAIRTLIGVAATCTFTVGPAPTDDGTTSVDWITVRGDGTLIERDTTHAGGYDYTDSTHNTIEIHGALCDQVKSGDIKEVAVNFTCLTP